MALHAAFDRAPMPEGGDQRGRPGAGGRVRALTVGVWILTGLAFVFALRLGRPLLIPLTIGLLLSYVLEPLVTRLVIRGIRREIAATVVFVGALAAFGLTGYFIGNQATALVAKLPDAAQQLRKAVERRPGTEPGAIAQVQQAADELQEVSKTPPAQRVQRVQIEQPSFNVAAYLLASTGTAISVAADIVVIVFLAFYLLLAGDLFRRLFLELAGPTLSQKRITLKVLDEISSQIGAYLFVRALISVIVATATGLALWGAGLAQPAAWGVVAGILNVAPYVGPIIATAAIGIAAVLQFKALTMPLVIVGLTGLIAFVEGYLLTPWLTSRAAEMNPVAVFVGLAFWGWVWGPAGLLLAVPLMMILKAIGEHVESLRPIVTLLKATPGARANGTTAEG